MVSQTAAISKVDINWLACHLGHDVSVHREFYRPHHFTTELAKVSELLLAVASGNLEKLIEKTWAICQWMVFIHQVYSFLTLSNGLLSTQI